MSAVVDFGFLDDDSLAVDDSLALWEQHTAAAAATMTTTATATATTTTSTTRRRSFGAMHTNVLDIMITPPVQAQLAKTQAQTETETAFSTSPTFSLAYSQNSSGASVSSSSSSSSSSDNDEDEDEDEDSARLTLPYNDDSADCIADNILRALIYCDEALLAENTSSISNCNSNSNDNNSVLNDMCIENVNVNDTAAYLHGAIGALNPEQLAALAAALPFVPVFPSELTPSNGGSPAGSASPHGSIHSSTGSEGDYSYFNSNMDSYSCNKNSNIESSFDYNNYDYNNNNNNNSYGNVIHGGMDAYALATLSPMSLSEDISFGDVSPSSFGSASSPTSSASSSSFSPMNQSVSYMEQEPIQPSFVYNPSETTVKSSSETVIAKDSVKSTKQTTASSRQPRATKATSASSKESQTSSSSAKASAKTATAPATVPATKTTKAAAEADTNSMLPTMHQMIAHPRAAHEAVRAAVEDRSTTTQMDMHLLSLTEPRALRVAGLTMTKMEERELKQLRRRLKNKLAAAESRRRKKSLMSTMEQRMAQLASENDMLRRRVQELEAENALLKKSNHPQQTMPNSEQHASSASSMSTCVIPVASSLSLSSSSASSSASKQRSLEEAESSAPPAKRARNGNAKNSSLVAAFTPSSSNLGFTSSSSFGSSTGVVPMALMIVVFTFGLLNNLLGIPLTKTFQLPQQFTSWQQQRQPRSPMSTSSSSLPLPMSFESSSHLPAFDGVASNVPPVFSQGSRATVRRLMAIEDLDGDNDAASFFEFDSMTALPPPLSMINDFDCDFLDDVPALVNYEYASECIGNNATRQTGIPVEYFVSEL